MICPPRRYFWALFSVFLAVVDVHAQSTLNWSFTQDVGNSLPECASLAIDLSAGGSSSASYYMIALGVNGRHTTSFLGSDVGKLSWTVNQPAGTSVLLSLVDSKGNSAILPEVVYTVTAGQSSDCLPSSSSSSFTMSANVTDALSTCDFWQLTVQGGTPPYNLMLASPGGPPTNVTMEKGENRYTYVNRASPKGTLLAAISDSAGMWATGSPYVRTQGSTDTTCPGRLSSSGVVSSSPSQPSLSPSSTSSAKPSATSNPVSADDKGTTSTNKVPIIVGVCVGVGVLLVIGALIFWFCVRRRRAEAKRQYLQPEQFKETGSQALLTSTAPPSKAQLSSTAGPSSQSTPPASAGSSAPRPSSSEPPSSDGAAPAVLPVVVSKAREASSSNASGMLSAHRATASESQSEDSRWPRVIDENSPDPGEVLIQHTDAGGVRVRELPPPYGTQTSM